MTTNPKLLLVGPGPNGRGGIDSVIRLHQATQACQHLHAQLLPTYDDRSPIHKIASALRAYTLAPLKILASDIVHIHLAAQVSLLRKLPILLLARLLRRPVIVHLHAATPESLFHRTPRTAVQLTFRSAARVIALSESWATLIRTHIPQARVVVIPNPVQLQPPVPPPTHPVILSGGKLDARKGYRDLLAAAPQVLAQAPTAQFWFAGHGEVEQARALAQHLGIASQVKLLGWVDARDLPSIYRQATLLALPSYGEGLPMSVIEAMSHSLPVLATPVGGLPEWITHNHNGLLVPPGDVPALATQILRLLQNPQLAHALGVAGRTTVQHRCTLEIVSAKLEALYSQVLEETRKKSRRHR